MQNPLLERLIYNLRDPLTRPEDFRESLEKIGEYLGLEIASDFKTKRRDITTLLNETARQELLEEQPVLIAVLRAGIPLYLGLQRAFPQAESGFVGAMRDEVTLKSKISYIALPDIENKIIIVCDTMQATSGTLIDVIELIKKGKAKQIVTVSAIASKYGLDRIREYDPKIKSYVAAIDPNLNEKGYILPGLGDAGDRCFGTKK